MKKNLILIACLTSFTVLSANAIEFNKDKMMSTINNVARATANATSTSQKSTTETKVSPEVEKIKAQIIEFNKKLDLASSNVQSSVQSIANSLTSKDVSTELKKKINEINQNTKLTEAEKEAMLADLYLNFSNTLKQSQSDIKKELENASSVQKAQLTKATEKLASASTTYSESLSDLSSIVKGIITKPSVATNLTEELKDLRATTSALKDNLKSLKNITTQVYNICQSSGVAVSK